ncbi:MAG TPA: 2Fe-2S iron-sulfur cluster-binding protein, partial [Methanoregula sp.]|nr:2Fe-2S iron-sulfur cluster-binding protein [Methanoregula sp.]
MPETARVLFHPVNKTVTVPVHSTVLDAIRLAEIPFEAICGGKGECNKCKVIFLSGSCTAGSPISTRGLLPEEIERRYCRACQTLITGDCEFALPAESRIDTPRILQIRSDPHTPLSPAVAKFLLLPVPDNQFSRVHRSLRLEGYAGTRPNMTRAQHDELLSARDTVTVTITTANGYPEVIRIEDGNTRDYIYGIALDLGTTTIAGVLVNLANG